ncbi:hypothetical protein DUNSADRAFT_6747 [Dunaliella salina]|uniref:Asparagine synthetase domain-containing protein n=1 Tax=Dunaliella salina TaxID=3046 RepID=A0ABQ7H6M6_DUNSA|nr:hypothetical protein DUNSADRAFT_6747 [Dunaliella salina]|eukprot:KAF5842503.1 hypothetical protein DUNSADRAFT_6747 [Dunaliella salina]
MCGIAALVSGAHVSWQGDERPAAHQSETVKPHPCPPDLAQDIMSALQVRGPDHQGQCTVKVGGSVLQLLASLLQLRGCKPSSTPLQIPDRGSCSQHHASSPATSPLVQKSNEEVQQEHLDARNVLCYNGEIFGGLHVPAGENDGRHLLEALSECDGCHPEVQSNHVLKVLNSLRGPWAVIFWQPSTRTLWFGRDFFGRRSLLAHFPSSSPIDSAPAHAACTGSQQGDVQHRSGGDGSLQTSEDAFVLTSVAPATKTSWPPAQQLTEDGAFGAVADSRVARISGGSRLSGNGGLAADAAADDGKRESSCGVCNHGLKRGAGGGGEDEGLEGADRLPFGPGAQEGFWQEVPPGVYSLRLCHNSSSSGSSSRGVWNNNSSAIHINSSSCDINHSTTSGSNLATSLGAGCEAKRATFWKLARHQWQDPLLLRLSQYPRTAEAACAEAWKGRPPAQSVVQNVTPNVQSEAPELENCRGASGVGAVGGEAEGGGGNTMGKKLQEAGGAVESEEGREAAFQGHVARVLNALRRAVQLRCCCIEQHGAPGMNPQPDPPISSPVLILFSGGVDSTLLAALTHEVLPPHVPIELCNVCFAGGSSPDRVAARDALEELAAVAPTRDWRLIEVDSNLEEVDAHSARILSLLHPAGTIMDLNIGAALWLAVGARGTLRRPASWCTPKQPTATASTTATIAAAAHVTSAARASSARAADASATSDPALAARATSVAYASSAAVADASSSSDPAAAASAATNLADSATGAGDSNPAAASAADSAAAVAAAAAAAAAEEGSEDAEKAAGSSCQKSSCCQEREAVGPVLAAGKTSPGWLPTQADATDDGRGIAAGAQDCPKERVVPLGQQMQDDVKIEEGGGAAGARYCSSARVVLLGHGADEQCAGYGRHRTRSFGTEIAS